VNQGVPNGTTLLGNTYLILLATKFHFWEKNESKNQITTMLYQIHTLQIKNAVDATLLTTVLGCHGSLSVTVGFFMVYLRI
jgi:hypothetical protein